MENQIELKNYNRKASEVIGEMTLAELATLLTGRRHEVISYPIIGDALMVDGRLSRIPNQPVDGVLGDGVECAYEWEGEPAAGKLLRIYVGTRWTGIMLSYDHEAKAWRNCYSNGNYGKNITHGGTWAADSHRKYPSALAALAERDYIVAGGQMKNNKYTESAALLEHVRATLEAYPC